jgi:5-methylthioadenosine/S-adenosylhomocysteine deaminase
MRKTCFWGRTVLPDSTTVIENGAVITAGDRIEDVGTREELLARHRVDEEIGGEDYLVIPGLINAHGHGKGLTDFQRGAVDDTLETWTHRGFPPIDAYLDTLWANLQLLEGGVTATMHNHTLMRPDRREEELDGVMEAYRTGGVRVALALSVRNRNPYVYGDNEAFVAGLPADLQDYCRRSAERGALFGPREYFEETERLRKAYQGEKLRVHHGPMAPQWVDEGTLLEAKRRSVEEGSCLFLHVQQTQLQQLWGRRTFGTSLIRHLEDIGVLGPNVSLGHCVWVDDEDIEALARTGVAVTHHASTNLRVRNGIAPVHHLVRAGIPVAVALDEKELGDEKDLFEELSVAARLHRVPSHRLASDHLHSRDFFRMVTAEAARAIGQEKELGALKPGYRGDIVLLDTRRMVGPYTYEGHDPFDLLVYRARKQDVRFVAVGGEVLVRNGKHVSLGREEVSARLRESIPGDYGERFAERAALLGRLKEQIRRWYEPWFDELEKAPREPYYLMNSRL